MSGGSSFACTGQKRWGLGFELGMPKACWSFAAVGVVAAGEVVAVVSAQAPKRLRKASVISDFPVRQENGLVRGL
jgi:hypothetical protein